jgi:hypothetical protein
MDKYKKTITFDLCVSLYLSANLFSSVIADLKSVCSKIDNLERESLREHILLAQLIKQVFDHKWVNETENDFNDFSKRNELKIHGSQTFFWFQYLIFSQAST